MELQEAINHALEVSEKEEECDICKSEHKQLADWLVELKDLRNILGDNYNIYELKDLIEVCWENECHNGSVDYNRLRELVEADREGRCVVLPCKIFDKIWNVAAHYQFEVTEIDLLPYGNILFRCGNKGTDDYAAFYGDDLGDTFTFEEPQERDNCVVKEDVLRREQDGNTRKNAR